LRRSILASSAVPGVLPPVEINGRLLSDGGIICVVPVRCALEEGANVVIAIPIDRDIYSVSGLQTAADIYVRAGEIQGFYLERNDLESADIVIRPELGDTHWTDFSQSKQLISLGESAALDSLPKIRRLAKSIALWALTDKIKKAVKRLFVIQPSGNG
jgi:NTE family protein